MTARAPLAVLLLAVLALVLWLALHDGSGANAGPVTDAPGAEPASRIGAPIGAAADLDGMRGSGERIPFATADTATLARTPLEILVVDAESKQPVAGAEVWVVAAAALPPAPDDPAQYPQHLRGIEERARELGQEYRTGPDGRIRTADPGPGTAVARSGERYGQSPLREPLRDPRDPVRVELAPDRNLRIRAIDDAGAPVPGIALAVRHWVETRCPPSQRPVIPTIERRVSFLGSTDSEGRLIVRHAQHHLSIAADPGDGRRSADVVLAQGGFDDSVRASFDVDDWPEQELLVRVPAFGSIVVELRGGSAEHAAALLQPLARGQQLQASIPFGPDRRARFARIALGTRFRIAHSLAPRIALDVVGPTSPGQQVECVLEVDEEPVELRYRLLDEKKRPLAGCAPALELRLEQGGVWSRSRPTGSDGVGTCSIADSFRRRRLEWIGFELGPGIDGPPLRARLEVGRALRPGTNDFGDVELIADPLLAAGQVVGLPEALLRDSGVFVESFAADVRTGRVSWRGLERITIRWQQDGRFELHGRCTAARARLSFVGLRLAPTAPVEFARGARSLRIELAPPGDIEQRLLLDEELASAGIWATLAPADGQRLPTVQLRSELLQQPEELVATEDPDRPNLLRWRGLAAGRYRIRVQAGVQPQASAAPVEVCVRAGETVRAPDVDLRGRIKRIRLELHDQNGVPLARGILAAALHRMPGNDVPWPGETANDGRLGLLLAAPADLAIFAQGFCRLDLDGVFEDRVIRLTPGPRVRLRVDHASAELPAAGECTAHVHPASLRTGIQFRTTRRDASLDYYLQHREPLAIGPDLSVDWQLSEPGDYVLSIRRASGGELRCEPRSIRVTDAPEQEFRIQVRAK
jgi:hypothetical protein